MTMFPAPKDHSPPPSLPYATPQPNHDLCAGLAFSSALLFFIPLILLFYVFGFRATLPADISMIALLVLPCAAVVLGLGTRTRMRAVHRRNHGLATAALLLGAAEFALLILFYLSLPLGGDSKKYQDRVKCASNLRQIGLGLLLYANDNHGATPPSLGVLIATADL